MGISNAIKNFIQPKVETQRLKINLSQETLDEEDDIKVESVAGEDLHELTDENNLKFENVHEKSNFYDNNNEDIKNIVEEVNKTSFFNNLSESTIEPDIVLPQMDDEASLQQLLDAIASEIINDNERRLSLAEQLALRLRNHLGIAKENNTQEVADKKLINFFKELKNRLNNMGEVL